MTPPASPDPPRPTSQPSGHPPSRPGDGDGHVKRGRWATGLVEGASRAVDFAAGPPTEPVPVGADAPPSASTARFPHLRALDGLRGVAVVAVVVYHFAPGVAPGGFLGVDLFFVLSGFLITSLLVNEWEGASRISLSVFWGRRARRLLPALFLVLAAVGAYTLLLGNRVDAEHIAQDGLSAFTYVANWHFISSGQSYIQQFVQAAPSPLRHMWSLAIEEQFYLIWPLLVLLVAKTVPKSARRPGHRRAPFRPVMVSACVTLGVLSFVRMVTLYHGASDVNRVYYGTDSRAFVILVGAALGACSMGVPTITGRGARRLIIAGGFGAVALLAAFLWTTTGSSYLYQGAYGVVAVVMVVVLAAAAQPGPNPLARILSSRLLVGLGLISYGVYLWHWPISIWVTSENTGVGGGALFFVRSTMTLAAALASYFLVELPIRQGRLPGSFLKNRGVVPMVLVTAVALILLIPAIAFPSVSAVPTTGGSNPSAVAVSLRYASAPRCDGPPGFGPLDPARTLRVELVGNSIAQEIRSCLGKILGARGATLGGQSPYGSIFFMCSLVPGVEKDVANPATRPDAAVFFALDAADSSCGPHATWQTAVQRLVKIWHAAGVHVFLVPPVPPVGRSGKARSLGKAAVAQAAYYQSLARHDPATITVLDAGTFIRDENGTYRWRMPCLTGEPGCNTSKTVGVRWTDAFHFCTYPAFGSQRNTCPLPEQRGGERRVAAAVAAELLPTLQDAHRATGPAR